MNIQRPKIALDSLSQSLYSCSWWTELDLLSPFKSVYKRAPQLRKPCSSRTVKAKPWLISRRRSILEDLPNEILLEIFLRMGCKDIISSQQTCKHLFEVSTARALWVSLYDRLSFESMNPPLLERPISTYATGELRTIVLRYISSEVNFATHLPSRTRTVPTARFNIHDDYFLLLEGGRWLLLS
ncbi:hypothetical protein BDN70DRAFT_401626 [Pholiota conissans]|uniref:F-box domain-containing protein n=1 Tax=Pholiota conissans TaxID=109636 RepID=A0A9P6D4J4_9AGAR|nr:hypothetical protein BDN70DRAFT_401626 [Pholiota conissans]